MEYSAGHGHERSALSWSATSQRGFRGQNSRDHATILTTWHSTVVSMNSNNTFRITIQCFNKGFPSDSNKFITNDTMSTSDAFEYDAVVW